MERAGRREAWGGASERSIAERADLSSFPGCWSEITQMCVWSQLCPLMLRKFLFSPIKTTSAQSWRSARPSMKAGFCCFSQVRHLLREPSQHLLHHITNMADGLLLAVSADEVEEQLLLISPCLQAPGCDLRRPLQHTCFRSSSITS